METTNTNTNALVRAIDVIANKFDEGGVYDYMGCTIKVIRATKPFKFINGNGNARTKSARYWGSITYPNGATEDFKNMRGGAIARLCGIYVQEENDKKRKATENGDVYETARKYFRENR